MKVLKRKKLDIHDVYMTNMKNITNTSNLHKLIHQYRGEMEYWSYLPSKEPTIIEGTSICSYSNCNCLS